MKWKFHPEKNFICMFEPVKYCLGSEKGQTRKKNRNLLQLYPEMAVWRHKYTPQMQELFEMIFQCKGADCCLIETNRWTWVQDYFCDNSPNRRADKSPGDPPKQADSRKTVSKDQIPEPTNPMPERKKERIRNRAKSPKQHQENKQKFVVIEKFKPTLKSLKEMETEYKLKQFSNEEKVSDDTLLMLVTAVGDTLRCWYQHRSSVSLKSPISRCNQHHCHWAYTILVTDFIRVTNFIISMI